MRFYNGAITWDNVWQMTLRQIRGMIDQIGPLIEMETGKKSDGPDDAIDVSRPGAVAAMKSQFPGMIKTGKIDA